MESYDQPRQHIKKQRHHFADKGLYSQSYDFSTSHVQMWELDHKEGWGPKNWCLQIVVLEKTFVSPLDNEIKPVNLKGNQSWIFIGRTDTEAEAPIIWPPDTSTQLIGKYPDAGKNGRLEEKGSTGWNSWMASLTQWTCVWATSRRQWRTEKPGVLQLMGLKGVRHDLELNNNKS